jgi:iron complex outermembrane receptor protein
MPFSTIYLLLRHPRFLFAVTILTGILIVPGESYAWQYQSDTVMKQSITELDSITVTAFRQQYRLHQLPASTVHLTQKDVAFMGGTSLLPAVNLVPGVRMEERSPGSYRFSIRGSLLRSPFGVRNIKIYLNNVPLTDAGGNTYLNLLPAGMVESMDILKGPAASTYGSGTGGVVLLQTGNEAQPLTGNRISAAVAGGSFGLFRQQLTFKHKQAGSNIQFYQDHQQADGYRQQSALRRDAVALNWQQEFGQHVFTTQVLYSNLFYQTPGGLNLVQYLQNPRQARPATGTLPGAVAQNTSVSNQTALVSLAHQIRISDTWQLQSFIMSSQTRFVNPFITNYEKRKENNWGAGSTLQFIKKKGTTIVEWLTGFESTNQQAGVLNFGNKRGNADTLQLEDNLRAAQWFAFSQLSLQVGHWRFDGGISLNQQNFNYHRISIPGSRPESRQLNTVATPRLSITRKISAAASLQFVVSRGFSPPTLAEIRPSDGNFYGDLQAEVGWNTELGLRWNLIPGRLNWSASIYRFVLDQAIVRRNSATGTEYFVNAGGTLQQGWETTLNWQVLPLQSTIWQFSLQVGHCYQPYLFKQYKQGNIDYSGNPITGVPIHVFTSRIQLTHLKGLYIQVQGNGTAALPLNDANDEQADAYQLIQAEAGWRINQASGSWHFFIAADNLFNQTYSLGNDINAAGRRYYNAAPPLNIVAGIRFNGRSFLF